MSGSNLLTPISAPMVHFRCTSVALVQWLALVTMLIDHLGAIGLLGDWSRYVGRFAIPAFVLMIAYNALNAAAPGRMAFRCCVLLLLSQPAYALALGHWDHANFLAILLTVVLLCWFWRDPSPLGYLGFMLTLLTAFVFSPWIGGGVLSLLLVPLVLIPSPVTLLLALFWPVLQYWGLPFVQLAALVSLLLVLVLLRLPFDVPRAPRWLSRWFYPGHLFVLFLFTSV